MHAGADASVVRRTMSARATASLPCSHYLASFVIRKKLNLWLLTIFGGTIQFLAGTSIGRWMILNWPELFSCGAFSKAGPTQEQMDGTSFVMRHFGYAFDSSEGAIQKKVCIFSLLLDFCTFIYRIALFSIVHSSQCQVSTSRRVC